MVYEPSPKQIKEACENIQRGWTERERRSRSVNKQSYACKTQVISLSDLPDDTRSWIDSVNRMGNLAESGD